MFGASCYDTDLDKIIFSFIAPQFQENDERHLTVVCPTISGTNVKLSHSIDVVAENAADFNYTHCCYDPLNDKVIFAYGGGSSQNAIVAGTVNGPHDITWGTPVLIEATTVSSVNVSYDESAEKILLSYNSKVVVASVAGDVITLGTAVSVSSSSLIKNQYIPDLRATMIVYNKSSLVNGRPSYDPTANRVVAISGTKITSVRISSYENITWESPNNQSVGTFPMVVYNEKSDNHLMLSLQGGNASADTQLAHFQVTGTFSIGKDHSSFATTGSNNLGQGIFDPESEKILVAYSSREDKNGGYYVASLDLDGNRVRSISNERLFAKAYTTSGTERAPAICYHPTKKQMIIVGIEKNPKGYRIFAHTAKHYVPGTNKVFGVMKEAGLVTESKLVYINGADSDVHTDGVNGEDAYLQRDRTVSLKKGEKKIGKYISATTIKLDL